MRKAVDHASRTVLEQMVDNHSLENVILALALICSDKADHIQTNWQDAKLADEWNRAGTAMIHASESPRVRTVSK